MKNKLSTLIIMATKYTLMGILLQCFFLQLLIASELNAQKIESIKQVQINVDFVNTSIIESFRQIENISGYSFAFDEKDINEEIQINLKMKNRSIADVLIEISRLTNLKFKQVDKNIHVSKKVKQREPSVTVSDLFQTQTITGKVTSYEDGEGLPGVNIVEKGTTNGTVTDVQGNYSLEVSEGATIVFSSVGYTPEEVVVGNQSVIDLAMMQDIQQLQELVVVGYGSIKKSDLTGSVGSIKSEEMERTMNASFEEALRGRVAGVQITSMEGTPGGGIVINIRGATSVNASNSPLYVIDGFPVLGDQQNADNDIGLSTQSPLASINPADIESIDILKDASATAIYGSRGANGVVIITTKSGRKGKNKIEFNAFTGVNSIPNNRKVDMLNGREYIEHFANVKWNNPTDSTSYYQYRFPETAVVDGFQVQKGDPIYTHPNYETIDWQDEMFRQGFIQSYQLSTSGGNENTTYALSGGFFDQEGIILGSDFSRYTLNLKLDSDLNNFKIGGNVNLGHSIYNGVVTSTDNIASNAGIITNILWFRPAFPLSRVFPDDFGTDLDDSGIPVSDRNGEISDPVRRANDEKRKNTFTQAFANIYAEYKISDDLNFRSTLGGNAGFRRISVYYPGDFGYGLFLGGNTATFSEFQSFGWINENTLSYNKEFNAKNSLQAVVGYSQQQSSWESLAFRGFRFPVNSPNVLDQFGSAVESTIPNTNRTDWSLQSFYGRANYVLNSRYLFTFTGRYDGSSRFPKGRKWGFFPSGAVGWRISEEAFMDPYKNIISDLKLRTSYGLTGNSEIPPYQSIPGYQLANYAHGQTLNSGFAISRLGNPDLTWETTKQFNFGVEIGFFDRIDLELNYYNMKTEDLLLEVPLAYTTGFATAFQNLGVVENKGLELSIGSLNIMKNDFTWSTNFNISFNRNKVIDLGGVESFPMTAPGGRIVNEYIVKVGDEFGSMFGFIQEGVYQESDFDVVDYETNTFKLKDGVPYSSTGQPQPGDIKMRDIAGPDGTGPDGLITNADRTIIGSAQPIHFGGMSNDIKYKNFDLSFQLQWSYGNEAYNKNLIDITNWGDPAINQTSKLLNAWTPENPDTNVPRIADSNRGPTYGGRVMSTYYVEDASFLRINNVTFGYSIPKFRNLFSSARLYVSVDNLHVFTNYSGFDPEVSVLSNPLLGGLDFGAYPRARTFRLGINLSL